MKCRKYSKYISSYIDGELNERTKNRLISHLDRCHNCKREYEQLREIRGMLGRLEQYELPDGFSQSLHIKLVEEENKMDRKKSLWRIVWSAGAGVLAILVIFFGIKGVMPKSKNAQEFENSGEEKGEMAPAEARDAAPEMDYDYVERESAGRGGVGDTAFTAVDEINRKLIKTAHLIVETLDFDSTVSGVLAKTSMVQGYVQSSTIEGVSRQRSDKSKRHADFTIRIPTKNLEKFTESLDSIGDVTHKEIYAEDITAEYFDTEARLKSLEIQEERLLTILSKAEKLQDIIELERELSEVRYEIENYTGTLKKWDNLVDYSTVHISIREVEQLKPELEGGFGERVSKGFMRSVKNLGKFFENMFATIIIWSPYILILGVLLWLIKIFVIDRKQNRDRSEGSE